MQTALGIPLATPHARPLEHPVDLELNPKLLYGALLEHMKCDVFTRHFAIGFSAICVFFCVVGHFWVNTTFPVTHSRKGYV